MMNKIGNTVLAGFASLLFVGGSYASDSVTVDGANYTLTYSGSALLNPDLSHETFRITLGIDTNQYSGGGLFLDNVGIKVSSDVTSVLSSAPGGTGNWLLISGGISALGCTGSGSGFTCAKGLANDDKGVAVTTGNGNGIDYSFVFDVTVNNGTLFTGVDAASIKARYVDSNGVKIGSIVSENITLAVPKPETYAMMLAGLGLMGFVARRRKQEQEYA